jgi:Fur family ferric uptake transcriptional regulator
MTTTTTEHPAPHATPAGRLTPEAILRLFDDLGLRNTRPRRLIAERISERAATGQDFTIQDFWADVQRFDPNIGRATVYRAVEVLVEHGTLDRVPVASGTHRYRVCGDEHHHHVRCSRCHRVVEIDACLPPELFASVANATDFTIDGHSLELFGRCALCRDTEVG